MALHWPTFFTRLGSAVVFAIVMMAGLLWNEWSFAALVLLIQVLCLREFFRLTARISGEPSSSILPLLVQIAGGAWLLLVAWTLFGNDERAPAWWPALLFVPVLLLLITALSKKNLLRQGFEALGALLYIVLPCLLFLGLYRFEWSYPLALVLMIWTNDTMAYLVGSFIGKTPFSPISPKKTWEGTAGGALLTVAGAALIAWFCQPAYLLPWVLMSLCAAVAGTAGDLLESKLKRMADVKDSGTMMPGHGGALDRFDSLLVAIPFAYVCMYILELSRHL